MTNCGPGGSGTESCCTSLKICGGTYFRTYTNSGSGPTGEADPATVSSFRLDKYEVTLGRFRQFVSAWTAGYAPPAGSGKHTHLNGGKGLANSASPDAYETGWAALDDSKIAPTSANLTCDATYSTWTASAGSNENKPVNCETWYESYAFCIWDGGFLPSEAEWEYSAAGGSQQREYPWGTANPGTGNEYAIFGCWYHGSGGASCAGAANIAPVGTATLGAGVWGQLDLAGNLWGWNLDLYAAYADPCTDCAYVSATMTRASDRVARGGDFNGALPQGRFDPPPSIRDYKIGFRCARTP